MSKGNSNNLATVSRKKAIPQAVKTMNGTGSVHVLTTGEYNAYMSKESYQKELSRLAVKKQNTVKLTWQLAVYGILYGYRTGNAKPLIQLLHVNGLNDKRLLGWLNEHSCFKFKVRMNKGKPQLKCYLDKDKQAANYAIDLEKTEKAKAENPNAPAVMEYAFPVWRCVSEAWWLWRESKDSTGKAQNTIAQRLEKQLELLEKKAGSKKARYNEYKERIDVMREFVQRFREAEEIDQLFVEQVIAQGKEAAEQSKMQARLEATLEADLNEKGYEVVEENDNESEAIAS